MKHSLLQLECEPLHISDSWTSAPTDERWNSFVTKQEMFDHLETKGNRKLKDLITVHEAEKVLSSKK